MRWTLSLIALIAVVTCSTAARTDPAQASGDTILEVVNEAGTTVPFTAADLAKLPQKELKAKDHSGDEAIYVGVLIADVLKKADVSLGERLRGKLLVNHLLVEAADKYRAVFSLPEVDPDWTDHVVLLATSRNGQALDGKHGPLQLVVPGDKRHSRWVKQVARLTVRGDSK